MLLPLIFRKVFFVLLYLSIPTKSFAVAIGVPEMIKAPKIEIPKLIAPKTLIVSRDSTMSKIDYKPQLGLGMKLNRVSVDDSIGETNKLITAQAFSVYFANTFPSSFVNFLAMPSLTNVRYLSELYVGNYAFEADATHTGQQVNQLGFRFTVQKKTRLARNVDPIFGLGFDISNTNYQKRHEVDSEGFLTNEYSNKTTQNLGVTLNVMKVWSDIYNMDVASKIEYIIPMGGELSRVSFGIILFFKNGSGHSSFSSERGEKH